jgi:hypothetical protein
MRPSHRTGIVATTLAATMSLLATADVTAADEPLEKIQTIRLKGPVGGLDHLATEPSPSSARSMPTGMNRLQRSRP